MHEKMLLKQEKLKNLKVFKGHHLRERSQKKAFKPRVVKKDNMDEETLDQKHYLGNELFAIL